MFEYLVGVDEAGRGPLAGPVAIGAVVIPADFDFSLISGVDDSKRLSPEKREAVFRRARELRNQRVINYRVAMVGASVIDRIGITKAIALGVSRALHRLSLDPAHTHIKLDGLLRAPRAFIHQETIIKGDSREQVIGLASILAKVTRDRHMVRRAALPRAAAYAFERHKGYGTKQHQEAIKTHGLSDIHRRSFCKNLQV